MSDFLPVKVRKRIENLNKILDKFFIEVFLRTRRLHYWQPHWKKKWQFAKTFWLSVRRRKKKFKTFFRKTYLSKRSCKHVESGSGSPAAIFLTKGQRFFTQCPEMIKKSDGFFCQLCWKIFDWMPKSICSLCENYKNYLIFSQKNSVWSRGHVESSFHNPAENFSPEGRKSLAHLWKR